MTLVKICGITREADLHAALDAGADAIGLNFFPKSPRYLDVNRARTLSAAIPAAVWKVGLFVDAPMETILATARSVGLDTVQLLYHEIATEHEVLIASRHAGLQTLLVRRIDEQVDLNELVALRQTTDYLLLDTLTAVGLGGTGHQIAEVVLERLRQTDILPKAFLAGGLTPENVAEKVARLKPFGVDVASGVESAPGIKSESLLRRFIFEAQRSDSPA